MLVSVTEAAKVAGCARSTIYDKINSGEISRSAGGKIDTAELLRVFGELQTPGQQQADDKSDTNLQAQPDIVLSAELLDMVQAKDAELASVRDELSDARERLQEHREAARALIDPKDFEAKQREWKQALDDRQTQIEQVRTEADTKESEWRHAIADRQAEIQAARAEADQLRQTQADHAEKLRVESEKNRVLESRGLFARIMNKKPELNA